MQQRARMRFRYLVCNAVAEIQLGRKHALPPLCMGGSNGPRCSGDPCNLQPEPIDEFVHPSTEAPPLGYDRLFGQGANKRPRLMQPPPVSPERTRPIRRHKTGFDLSSGPVNEAGRPDTLDDGVSWPLDRVKTPGNLLRMRQLRHDSRTLHGAPKSLLSGKLERAFHRPCGLTWCRSRRFPASQPHFQDANKTGIPLPTRSPGRGIPIPALEDPL